MFAGNIYANLEDPNRIYWHIDGDFYDKGTTTGSGAVDIGVGEGATVSFGLSYADNYYD